MAVSTTTSTEGEAEDSGPILERGRAAGLTAVGVTSAAVQQPARDVLHLRKQAGRAGDMQFTYRNPDRSTDPASVLPSARSVIVGALAYGQWEAPVPSDAATTGRVARYAWHDHYADLKLALEAMAGPLRATGHKAVVVADTNGLVDRNAAWSAGLGWYGKNANLLLPGAGSWFVLGAVITNAALTTTGPPVADGCGPCTRCLDDCPTGAIVAPGVVDATRCLAWLVQADGPFPRQWREALGDRIYGCDDCQEVCPPNRQASPGIEPSPDTTTTREPDSQRATAIGAGSAPVAETAQVDVDLDWLLAASDEEILTRHGRWYIAGRNVDNVRRSALIVLGNTAVPGRGETIETLARYLDHPEPVLRAHAVWAARRLGLSRLAARAANDPDPEVLAEFAAGTEARFDPTEWGGTARSSEVDRA